MTLLQTLYPTNTVYASNIPNMSSIQIESLSLGPPQLNRIIRPITCSLLIITALVIIASTANATTQGPYAYIPNPLDNTVSVIDTQTNNVTATIQIGKIPKESWPTTGPAPEEIAVNPTGTRVYVANHGINNVSVIDAASNTLMATVPVGNGTVGIAVTPDGTKIYAINSGSTIVSVIDAATNTVTATVNVGKVSYAFGEFIGPAIPMSTPTPVPFVGVEGIGAILLGAGLYMATTRRRQ